MDIGGFRYTAMSYRILGGQGRVVADAFVHGEAHGKGDALLDGFPPFLGAVDHLTFLQSPRVHV